MKKITIILIILLTVSVSLFAWKELDFASTSQGVIAHINGVFELEVSEFYYANDNEGKGINLNINDENNNFRYLIAPSSTPKSIPGLLIANFSLISSSSDYKLTISHDKLTNKSNHSIKYDYELSTVYSVLKGTSMVERTVYCLSEPESSVLNFNELHGVLMLQNAGLYLRLCNEVVDSGEYESTITLVLESLQ